MSEEHAGSPCCRRHPVRGAEAQFVGPLIYGFSEDAVAAAKVVADFSKTNDKLVIRVAPTVARPLTPMKSRPWPTSRAEVLLAQPLGLLQTPISGLARVIAEVAKQKGGGAEAPAAEAAA